MRASNPFSCAAITIGSFPKDNILRESIDMLIGRYHSLSDVPNSRFVA